MTGAGAPAILAGLVLVPAAVGVVLLLLGRRSDRPAGPVALVTAGLVLVLAVAAAGTRPSVSAPFLSMVDGGDLVLEVDGLSAVLVLTVAAVAAAVVAFAVVDETQAPGRLLGYLLVFTAAMLATVTATTLPALLLAWEVMGATSYALIGFVWQIPGKTAAGTTAFVTTRAGDLGLYVAAGAALAGTGSLELAALASADGVWVHVAGAGVLVAALGKSAQLPFSAWLSAAMEGPSAVSALLHSATMVAAGGYLLLRTQPLLAATGWAAAAAAWVGVLTALVLGLVAAAQVDLKQLLAASTGAQIGFVVLAAGLGSVAGGTAQLVAHAGVKAALFVVAGAWLTSLGTKQLPELRGAARRGGVGAAGVVAALALAGVPPLSLWLTKDWAAAGAEGPLRVATLAAGALSAVYAGRVLAVVLAPAAPRGTGRVPWPATASAWALALLAVGPAVLAVPPLAARAAALVGDGDAHPPALADLVLTGAVAAVVLAAVTARPAALDALGRGPLRRWVGLRDLLSPRPWVSVARVAREVDERVIDRTVVAAASSAMRLSAAVRRGDGGIDRTVVGVGGWTVRAAAMTDRVDDRAVDAGVHRLAGALRALGGTMRRPQTGLLHQYYAQALGGLGVLFVLLLLVR